MSTFRAGPHRLPLGGRTLVMGVVNVTPDSFSDGGRFLDPEVAVAHGKRLLAEGADILDVGGESTRPGAEPVAPEIEARRVIPVVRELAALGSPVSIDTRRVEVAREALDVGACIVNDVSAFADPGMAALVAARDAGCVLMHKQGEPRTMQEAPSYVDVVREVRDFLAERAKAAEGEGVRHDAIIVDPGLGFGKSFEHNAELLRALPSLASTGYPVIVGHSRKSFVGRLLDDGRGAPPANERIDGSVAVAVLAAQWGAAVVRAHDVAETVRALRVADRLAGRVPLG